MAAVIVDLERFIGCLVCFRHYRVGLSPYYAREADISRACRYTGHSPDLVDIIDWNFTVTPRTSD